jgi:hypothetical protein
MTSIDTPSDLAPGGPVAFASADDTRFLLSALQGAGGSIPITLALPPDDLDVEGHALSSTVGLNLRLGDDDTEGHAISLQFPTTEAAARFRRNLLLAGALAGSIVIGTTGAVVISSQAAPSTDVVPQIEAPVHAWPAGHGPMEGADPPSQYVVEEAAPLPLTPSVNPATDKPWDRGFVEDADGAPPALPLDPAPGHGNLEDPG